ncbi:MAG: pantothenate synthetase [Bacteroidota bacterium]
MEVFDNADFLTEEIEFLKSEGQTIGFVPTMGALHDGHLSLVRQSRFQCDQTVASVFVNPTQFNNPADLKNYPRTLESDIEMLRSEYTDILFAPAESEIYPDGTDRSGAADIDLGSLDRVMEGAHRPGHFRGVVQVVHRLFDIVRPDVAFFGEKDFQQLAVIRRMVEQLALPVRIVGCPTCRESDGLAMSSRNLLLTAEERAEAPVLYRALSHLRKNWEERPLEQLKAEAVAMIRKNGMAELEYLEVADATTLEPVAFIDGTTHVRCFVAARLGAVRLIDNEAIVKPY